MAQHGGIFSGGGVSSPGPFGGVSVVGSAGPNPSPNVNLSIFDDAPGTLPGAIPGTDAFGIPDSGLGGQQSGVTPLPQIQPNFANFDLSQFGNFDTSKFGFDAFNLNTPGGKFSFNKGNFNFESGLGGLRSEGTRQAFAEADRLDQVAEDLNLGPLTKARLAQFDLREQQLDLRESEVIGTLRDSLASRRVLGASFATAQVKREQAGFRQTRNDIANKRALVAGESKLQEFQLRQQALTQASQTRTKALQLTITERFGETQLAAQLGSQIASLMEGNLRARLAIEFADLQQQRALGQLDASQIRALEQRERESLRGDFQATKAGEREESAGFGSLIGSLLTAPIGGPAGAAGGSIIGNLLGGIF